MTVNASPSALKSYASLRTTNSLTQELTMKNETTSGDQTIEDAVDSATDAVLMQTEQISGTPCSEEPIGVAGLMKVLVEVTV